MSGPSNKTIIGVAILLFSSVLLGVGMHHVIGTGTCSSTGYSSNYGPVPTCPSGTGWWIAFIMVGVWGGVIGGLMGGASTAGLIVGSIFSGIGLGSLSVVFDAHTASGEKAFAIPFGGIFALVGVVAMVMSVMGALSSAADSSRRPRVTQRLRQATSFRQPTVVSNAFTAPANSSPPSFDSFAGGVPDMTAPAATPPTEDPLDQVAKLAELHKQGVLTDEEFATQKAKLLGI